MARLKTMLQGTKQKYLLIKKELIIQLNKLEAYHLLTKDKQKLAYHKRSQHSWWEQHFVAQLL